MIDPTGTVRNIARVEITALPARAICHHGRGDVPRIHGSTARAIIPSVTAAKILRGSVGCHS